MAELFGLKNGEERIVKIGKTFGEGCSDFYHTIRYDFKPASVDNQKCGLMEIEEKEVNVTVPLVEGHGAQEAVYKGNKIPSSKDYILAVDHNTGEITLERVGYHIRVKRTRIEKKGKGHRISPYQRQSPSQGYATTGASPKKSSPRQSPGTSKSSLPQKSTPQSTAPGSMPIFPFEDNKSSYSHSIMSDYSSSDSDSNSGSSSSSDSDSDSEPETVQPTRKPNGMPDIKMRNGYNQSPNILDDLNLSEED